jgi:hypothetical protein
LVAADIVPVLIGGCTIALVSFADTSVLSCLCGAHRTTSTRTEMVGLGVANLAAGFFSRLSDQQQFVTYSLLPRLQAPELKTTVVVRLQLLCRWWWR